MKERFRRERGERAAVIGRDRLKRLQPWIERRIFEPVGLLLETLAVVRTRAQIAFVRRRATVHRRFPGPQVMTIAPRVVAVVTHVAPTGAPDDRSVARLERTVEGLLESLGHTRLTIVVNTLAGRHATADLPAHQRARITVSEHDGTEPMFLGFEAQNEFARRVDDGDWFLFTEDDLVLSDSLVLEKLAFFNDAAPANAVLLPHRYELMDGRKFYVDLWSKTIRPEDHPWNRLTTVEIEDWRFVEFQNPHSGFYCLSRTQLLRWLDTGRRWYGIASYVGPLESAASGALLEAFRLYKPHPATVTFFEIRHLGTKYAELYSEAHGLSGS